MAEKKKGGSAAKKGGSRKLYTLYSASGEKMERKNRTCPKCGPGMFMANHSNRSVCGKCGYVEMKGK